MFHISDASLSMIMPPVSCIIPCSIIQKVTIASKLQHFLNIEKDVHSRLSSVCQVWLPNWKLSQTVATKCFQFSKLKNASVKAVTRRDSGAQFNTPLSPSSPQDTFWNSGQLTLLYYNPLMPKSGNFAVRADGLSSRSITTNCRLNLTYRVMKVKNDKMSTYLYTWPASYLRMSILS